MKNCNFIFTYRESDETRRKNLDFLVTFIKNKFPKSKITIIEQDKESYLDYNNINHIFVYNNNYFNKNWGYNIGAKKSDEDILIFNDIDVFMSPFIIKLSINKLDSYKVISPYKRVKQLTKQSTKFLYKNNIKIKNIDKKLSGRTLVGAWAGGILIMKKKIFNELNGFPEFFFGWGYEDDAIKIKLNEVFNNNKLKRIDNKKSFHLYHTPMRWEKNPTTKKNKRKYKQFKKDIKNKEYLKKILNDKKGNLNRYV